MFRSNKTEFDIKDLEIFINQDRLNIPRFEKLQDYYECRHDILKKEKDNTLYNNHVVNPYGRYIVDMLTGYFMGQPVRYSAIDGKNQEDDLLLEELVEIYKKNDEQLNNMELAKICGIKGVGYEILWTDEEANIRFKYLQPDGIFFIHDNTLDEKVLRAVRYYDRLVDGQTFTYIEEYSDSFIRYYNNENGHFSFVEERPHYFGEVPVIQFKNNEECMGDFEPVLTQIDAYDLAQSNTLNDIEDFTDAFLVLVNMSGTTIEDVIEMKKQKTMLLESDGKAEFLTKDINDSWIESNKNRLNNDIHKFSYTPDMTDENFGNNVSGVSLRYKLIAMEQLRATKERNFKKGLQKRIKLICNFKKLVKKDFLYTGIGMQFSNTLPQNTLEMAQIIQILANYLPIETLIEQLPFIENAKEEMEKKKVEEEEDMDIYTAFTNKVKEGENLDEEV